MRFPHRAGVLREVPLLHTAATSSGLSGIPCPICGGPSRTTDSRPTANGMTRRRRRCSDKGCEYRFTTFEATIDQLIRISLPELVEIRASLDRLIAQSQREVEVEEAS